ncbi:MAG: type II toxin-antitoxin system Phd/YefM family antitoxin [Bacteroidetes bacterium]|nr:type II toxin-antitoxin system Phd/YefM family antitoxin [Bacteroidota bacterium]
MKLSEQIKPISYLKAHAAEMIRTLGENGESIVITQNGEAKAVLQDIRSWEQNQETMALLKILAIGNQEIAAGAVIPLEQSLQSIREKIRK